MEKRKYPRIQIPLLVELTHPTIGTVRALARDISEGGVFLDLPDTALTTGAKVKLTLLNIHQEEHQSTPTVDATIVRVEEHGVGLEFSTVISRHLWKSVRRVRDELAIGRDYFQVHQSAAIVNEKRQLLVVHQYGKWRYPGTYLVVGKDWEDALGATIAAELGIAQMRFKRTLAVSSTPEVELPEAAVLQLTHLFRCSASPEELPQNSPYSSLRWLSRPHQADELTFMSTRQRDLSYELLTSLKQTPDTHP